MRDQLTRNYSSKYTNGQFTSLEIKEFLCDFIPFTFSQTELSVV